MEERVRSEFVDGVLKILESRLEKIVLYGSAARGTDTEESDIDIALIMYDKLDSDTEDRLSDFVVDMNLKYDKVFLPLISMQIISEYGWKHCLFIKSKGRVRFK